MEDCELDSCESLSRGQPLQHVTLPTDEVSTRDKLKLYCKPTYRIRRVKTKGALLMLLWNLLAVSGFWYAAGFLEEGIIQDFKTIICISLVAITLPVAGWLADVCIGRYKIIYCSFLISWVATILNTASVVVQELVSSYQSINVVVEQILQNIMAIGLVVFVSTVLQFGIDQLHDASSVEVSAFTVWYLWTSFGPVFILRLIIPYILRNHQNFVPFILLLLCINLTVILISLFCCNNWLIREPISQNPFTLIYRVTKYAFKTKYPQYRSAFTYCEDEIISRIDFGKSKYGGPFTSEQVEDVKTFYKTLPIIILAGILGGEVIATWLLDSHLKFQFVLPNYDQEKIQDASNEIISHIIPYSFPVLIVLNEVFLYPIFHRCCQGLTSLHKFSLGEMIQIAALLALMTFEILSRQAYLKANGYNETVSCVFYEDQVLATNFNYNWIAIPDFLFALSITLMAVSGLEFIAAQVPYSMKGVILGVTYCSSISTIAINFALFIPLHQKMFTWGTGVISCGFWYALAHIIFCTLGCIFGAIITKWYKRRKREDVLPNEHFYAEQYYSQNSDA